MKRLTGFLIMGFAAVAVLSGAGLAGTGTSVTITELAAHTGYAQRNTWVIDKTATPSSVSLPADGVSTAQITYAVTVSNTGTVNTNFVVHDSIQFNNPNAETVTAVSAYVVQDGQTIPATISLCPLPTTDSEVCHYNVSLLNDDPFTVTATVTASGGSTSQTISVPNLYANLDPMPFTPAQLDTCVSVNDTNSAGPQNAQVCLNTPPPATFSYQATVGPYTTSQCGNVNVANTAGFTTNNTGATGSATANVSVAVQCPPPCPQTPPKVNVRWHYSANGSSGSWSATKTAVCGSLLTMGPQAMEGDLKVSPGTTIKAGYDFTLPGNNTIYNVTFTNPQVVFIVHCASGATPSQPTFTLPMNTATYTAPDAQWYPSGNQQSPLVYQGSIAAPDLCGGGQLRLDKGGTFSATVTIS